MRRNIAMFMLVMLAVSGFSFLPSAGADTVVQSLWIRMHGKIIDWDRTPAFGWVGAHARIINDNGTIHKWAGAHAVWSTDRPRLNRTEPLRENVTFTLHIAQLVNQSDVMLNYKGAILHISGLWDVVNMTTTILVKESSELISITRTITPWIIGARGVLRVPTPPDPLLPLKFVLAIDGMPPLSGFVVEYIVRYTAIKIYDLNDDGKVDLVELVKIARRYLAAPGLPTYDPDMDFNLDARIDIGDLTTVAANMDG